MILEREKSRWLVEPWPAAARPAKLLDTMQSRTWNAVPEARTAPLLFTSDSAEPGPACPPVSVKPCTAPLAEAQRQRVAFAPQPYTSSPASGSRAPSMTVFSAPSTPTRRMCRPWNATRLFSPPITLEPPLL